MNEINQLKIKLAFNKNEQLELRFRLVMCELIKMYKNKNKRINNYNEKSYKLLIQANSIIIENIEKKLQLLQNKTK